MGYGNVCMACAKGILEPCAEIIGEGHRSRVPGMVMDEVDED